MQEQLLILQKSKMFCHSKEQNIFVFFLFPFVASIARVPVDEPVLLLVLGYNEISLPVPWMVELGAAPSYECLCNVVYSIIFGIEFSDSINNYSISLTVYQLLAVELTYYNYLPGIATTSCLVLKSFVFSDHSTVVEF